MQSSGTTTTSRGILAAVGRPKHPPHLTGLCSDRQFIAETTVAVLAEGEGGLVVGVLDVTQKRELERQNQAYIRQIESRTRPGAKERTNPRGGTTAHGVSGQRQRAAGPRSTPSSVMRTFSTEAFTASCSTGWAAPRVSRPAHVTSWV